MPSFAGPADLFEGAMHLSLLGLTTNTWANLLGTQKYRVTAYDVNGDGSRLLRRTWWGANGYEPQPRHTADREWEYVMKRVVDPRGQVDKRVLKEMKRVLGTHVVRAVPRLF